TMPRATSMMVFERGGQNTILVATMLSFRLMKRLTAGSVHEGDVPKRHGADCIRAGRQGGDRPSDGQRGTPQTLARLAVEDVVAPEGQPHAIAGAQAFDPGGLRVDLVIADLHMDDRAAVHGKIELLANDSFDAAGARLGRNQDVFGAHSHAHVASRLSIEDVPR